jgi:hypothetical protein
MNEAQIMQLVDSVFKFGAKSKLLAPVIPALKSLADLALPGVIKAWVGLDPKAIVDKMFVLLEAHASSAATIFCLQVLNRAIDAALPILLAGILGMGAGAEHPAPATVAVSIDFVD